MWDTNVIDGTLYGVPWYVDTRLVFYRSDLLARAGYRELPGSWNEWRRAMEALKRQAGPNRFAILLPANEFAPLVALALASGSPLLEANGTRGAFSEPAFRRALDFYAGIFRDRLAPPVTNNEIANLYQEFARGYFAHDTPEGRDPFERMREANVRFLTAGENLALAPTVQVAHRGLMNSPGHRANILHPQFGRVGIGILDGGIRGLMITQDFRN